MNKTICVVIIVVLAVGNVFFAIDKVKIQKELDLTRVEIRGQERSKEISAFLKLFVSKVIMAKDEIGFEDRLELENAVRDLNDKQIFEAWKRFVDSSGETNSQDNLKNLLRILVGRIS